jgi:hypothetical protein
VGRPGTKGRPSAEVATRSGWSRICRRNSAYHHHPRDRDTTLQEAEAASDQPPLSNVEVLEKGGSTSGTGVGKVAFRAGDVFLAAVPVHEQIIAPCNCVLPAIPEIGRVRVGGASWLKCHRVFGASCHTSTRHTSVCDIAVPVTPCPSPADYLYSRYIAGADPYPTHRSKGADSRPSTINPL